MKILLCILFFVAGSCSSNNLSSEYKLYRNNRHFNYPAEKLRFEFLNDTAGIFINKMPDGSLLHQNFIFLNDSNYILIRDVDTADSNNISLKTADTIIHWKRQLIYTHKGFRNYILYFK